MVICSALIVIDTQNDYLENGKFPLWNMDNTLAEIKHKISEYKKQNLPIIFIRHLSGKGAGFFADDNTIIINKRHGNSFDETELDET